MRALRFFTELRLEPFGDPVSAAFLGGEELGLAVARALIESGARPEPGRPQALPAEGPVLLLPDSLFVTRAAVRALLAAAGAGPGVYQLALRHGPVSRYARPLQRVDEDADGVRYDLFLARGSLSDLQGAPDWETLRARLSARARPVLVDPGSAHEPIPQIRPGPERSFLELPRSLTLAADVRHWVHVLWLNHLLPRVRLGERQGGWLARLKPAGATPANLVGRGCDIHPTALVEGSILGAGVKLGAFASVRDCILGDGVEIGSHGRFLRCVVGEGCHSLNDSYFIGCTFYPGSTLSNVMMRNSIMGRRVFLTTAVMFRDDALTAPVKVVAGGHELDTGRWVLGGCAGHGCLLGTRAVFEPGRTVPNRAVVVMRPEEGVMKLPESVAAGHPHVTQAGAVVPLEAALPGWRPLEIEPQGGVR